MVITDLNSLKRVDETHPLDLYIGTDNLSRQTFFFISDNEPKIIPSSQIIIVTVGKRKDLKWGISFILSDDKYSDIFNCFSTDIIESSRSIKDKNLGAEFILNRYIKWQIMLSKSRGELLSESVIKGLIGEMIFLQNYLIPLYGQTTAVNSWIGPDRADQDFICENLWYEAKATDSGSESVKISSVEQLDTLNSGELVIVYLDKTSPADQSKITLNGVYRNLSDSLNDHELKNKLTEILLNLGYYPRVEYDEPAFKLTKIDRYEVNDKFPAIRRRNLPDSVISLKYRLSVSAIQKHLKGD